MRYIILLLLGFLACGECFARSVFELDSYLFGDSLSLVRNQRQLSAKELNSNKDFNANQRFAQAFKLAEFYSTISLDSALVYWNIARQQAKESGNDSLVMAMRLRIDGALPYVGMGSEAINDFDKIDFNRLPENLKRDYYLSQCELYYNLSDIYPECNIKYELLDNTVEAIDSLLDIYPVDQTVHRYLYAYRNLICSNNTIAAALFAEMLPELSDKPELYCRATRTLADFYKGNPERLAERRNYLLAGVLKGFREGVVRPAIVAELGKLLYEQGDTKRGVALIKLALMSPQVNKGFFRIHNLNEYLPYVTNDNQRQTVVKRVVGGILVLLLAILVILCLLQRRKYLELLKECVSERAENTAKVNEIAAQRNLFLSLALEGTKAFDDFNVLIKRKLIAGQKKDILKSFDAGTFSQHNRSVFLESFDNSLLSSCPQFIERLNSLLKPEERFSLPENNSLTPELRIAAFMSLGLDDSSKIAAAMGLSLNTIYTYRNRLKNRALDRNAFEAKLKGILAKDSA